MGGTFDSGNSEEKIRELKIKIEEDNFWSNPDHAKKIMQSLSELESNSSKIREYEKQYKEINDEINNHISSFIKP